MGYIYKYISQKVAICSLWTVCSCLSQHPAQFSKRNIQASYRTRLFYLPYTRINAKIFDMVSDLVPCILVGSGWKKLLRSQNLKCVQCTVYDLFFL